MMGAKMVRRSETARATTREGPVCGRRPNLQRLPRRPAARPGPLEIVAAEPAGDIDPFADRVETGDLARRHRLRGQAGGVDAADGDLGLGEAFGAIRVKSPVRQLPGDLLEPAIGHGG